MNCFDEGRVRAFIDGELPELERVVFARHLSACSQCRALLVALQATANETAAHLPPPSEPDAHAALLRFRAVHPATTTQPDSSKEVLVQSNRSRGPRRTWLASLGVIATFIALLALPPVRAAADSLLQIFRVKQVVFVPVTEERARELQDLNFDGSTLFTSKPDFGNQGEAQDFADIASASSAAGWTLAAPTALPSAQTSAEFHVLPAKEGSFQVNVEQARELLQLLNVTDVTLPDALGEQPVNVKLDTTAVSSYQGEGYSLTLTQGRSPEVALPDGVDMAQLGSAMLQVLGSDAQQARTMAQSIDWSSTLVVPIPTDISEVQQVSINGATAMLVNETGRRGQSGSMLYWQRGDQFYVLQAEGLSEAELLVAAESVN